MKKWAKASSWILLLTAILSFSACGSKEWQRGIGGFVYEAEWIPDTQDWGDNFKVSGNWLYYVKTQEQTLYRLPLGEDGIPKGTKAERMLDGESIRDYTVDEEGSIYCYDAQLPMDDFLSALGEQEMQPADIPSNAIRFLEGTLAKYREDGSLEFKVSLGDSEGEYKFLSLVPGFLAAGAREQLFLLMGDMLLTIDASSGEVVHKIDISAKRPEEGSEGSEGLLEGGDGSVYYFAYNIARRNIYELVETGEGIHFRSVSGKGLKGMESNAGTFYGSPSGLLYTNSEGILQRYDSKEGKWQDLLRWSESDLLQDAMEAVWISESKILAKYHTALTSMDGVASSEPEFYLLDRKAVDELPEKVELRLACNAFCPRDVEDAVIRFNRSSDKYHVTIQVYDGEDSLMKLDAELVSSDPPDLLELSDLDVEKYGGKQALEDLSPYLGANGSLRRSDFLEGVLDGYTVGGRLVGIPTGFTLSALMGKASEVGDQAGWTMEDMIRLTEIYPGRKLNGMSFSRNLDMICRDYIMERFIDLEKGECNFDSEEFCAFVTWLAEHSGDGTDYYAYEEVENPLTVWEQAANFVHYIVFFARPGNGMSVIGFPSVDGAPLYHTKAYNAVGMTSKSRNKEGAWKFLEYYLSNYSGLELPTRKDKLEAVLEDALTPPEDPSQSEDASPSEDGKGKWTVRTSWDEERVEYECATQEEVDGLLDMIAHADFRPMSSLESTVSAIISEEMGSYFRGDKPIEEVAKIIQNRVTTLVQER